MSRKYRRHGVMNQLIQAAVEHSRQRGATDVETYPVAPDSQATGSRGLFRNLASSDSSKWILREVGVM
ncbi:GNAT family N-acetyltransferase [Cohnella sp. REN36]|uniref:GNAT family N-acetyltransferase n=1 Tax=Cohnella sp. REN36 TaxID=2887347 RepID=UPI00351D0299